MNNPPAEQLTVAHADCAWKQVGPCVWREWSGKAFHIRRRLTEREQEPVGPVVDIRGTPEALMRAARLGPLLRLAPDEVLMEELGTVPR